MPCLKNPMASQPYFSAKKTGIVPEDMELLHIGFGTMNGKDGKPFKTRDGAVMRLETLISDINQKMLEKILQNQKEKENLEMSQEECQNTAKMIALAALKYGDLSNQASKDYVFDLERFISFEGNTGPYILYTIVRMKSILAKYEATGKSLADAKAAVLASESDSQKELMLSLAKFNGVMDGAVAEQAPHKICAYS